MNQYEFPDEIEISKPGAEMSEGEIEIEVDKISTSEDGFSSGFGDLWQWSYYCTLSKKDADEYYLKELERVSKKYNLC